MAFVVLRRRLRLLAVVLLYASLAAIAAATVLAEFGEAWWIADLFAHFRYHYALGALLLVAVAAPEGVQAGDLRTLATDIRGRFGAEPAVVVLLGNTDGKVPFVVTVNKAAQELGVKAGDLVASFGPSIAGRGGGKPEMAQGAGTDPSGIAAGLAAVRARVAELAG